MKNAIAPSMQITLLVTNAVAIPIYAASPQHLSSIPVVVSKVILVVNVIVVCVVVVSTVSAQRSGVNVSAKLEPEKAGHGVVTPGGLFSRIAGVKSN